MQLLFVLAGVSTVFALKKRGNGRYAGERLLRLGIPLVFGIFVLIPPQTWYGGRFNSGYTESYWHYITSGDFLVSSTSSTAATTTAASASATCGSSSCCCSSR